jgi:hypothetical protein
VASYVYSYHHPARCEPFYRWEFVSLFPLRPTSSANSVKHATLQSLRGFVFIPLASCDTFATRPYRTIRNRKCCWAFPLPSSPPRPPKRGSINPLIAGSGLPSQPLGDLRGSRQRKQLGIKLFATPRGDPPGPVGRIGSRRAAHGNESTSASDD